MQKKFPSPPSPLPSLARFLIVIYSAWHSNFDTSFAHVERGRRLEIVFSAPSLFFPGREQAENSVLAM